jgi:hypothetical protein
MTSTPFPVWYASCETLPGCAIQLGGVTYFAPIEDAYIHVVTAKDTLIITGQIPEPMASYVRNDLAAKLHDARLHEGHLSQGGYRNVYDVDHS